MKVHLPVDYKVISNILLFISCISLVRKNISLLIIKSYQIYCSLFPVYPSWERTFPSWLSSLIKYIAVYFLYIPCEKVRFPIDYQFILNIFLFISSISLVRKYIFQLITKSYIISCCLFPSRNQYRGGQWYRVYTYTTNGHIIALLNMLECF